MRLKKAAFSLLAVALFCGYLISNSFENSGLPEPATPPSAVLLSQPVASLPPKTVPPVAAKKVSSKFGVESSKVNSELGTLNPLMASPPIVKPKYKNVWAMVTAYCPCRRCCGRHANGRTATGSSAWRRGAAADPAAIPYGTRIFVEGYGYVRIDDTGGRMRRVWRQRGLLQIDIRMTYHWQARQWGRKFMRVRIYDK